MATTHQPLLDSSNTTILSRKILYFVATAFALIFSAAFIVPNLITNPKSDICHLAHDPEECLRFVSELVSQSQGHVIRQNDGKFLLKNFLLNYVNHMSNAMVSTEGMKNMINDPYEYGALEDCLELIDLSIDRVKDSITALGSSNFRSHADAQSWLSGVLTNHVTCFEGLNFSRRTSLGKTIEDLISRSRASLGLLAEITAKDEEMFRPQKGKLPSWVTARDRKLLESSAFDIGANLVVVQDGTGDYCTLGEAVAAAPNKTKTRFVIYVKSGIYEENVEVIKNKKNLMIVGDGMDSTIITGSLNVVDGATTFRSATLAAVGDGFILQDISIRNTAGPEKHQAVALRVGADKSVINRCQIDGHQDSLYVHSHRQFYRDCIITGTIDFIFGNAAVVLQNSIITARKPMKRQKNMVTAQNRKDPNQNTGISIQYCLIKASDDLEPVKCSFPSFLGRPWKEYARVAVMESYIGDHIDPAGWAEWGGDFAKETLYFGEYLNIGPGSDTSNRVNWTGYHDITDPNEALQFTVVNLIQGDEWLASTGVDFSEAL